ncbi:hypothetical protein AAMO2058_000955000 [Amorphochlora amoebiformis]
MAVDPFLQATTPLVRPDAKKNVSICSCCMTYATSYHTKADHMGDCWQRSLLRFLHNAAVQDFLTFLLLLDIICVVSEILIEHYSQEGIEVPEDLELGLKYTSLSILITFCVEIFLYIVAKGLDFFTEPLEVFDMFIVAGSLYQDVVYEEATGGLLMLLRVWRFGRIFHGVWATEHERCATRIRQLESKVRYLRKKNKQLESQKVNLLHHEMYSDDGGSSKAGTMERL